MLSVLLLAGCGDDGFRPLVSLPRDFDAAWSPDGQRIAFRHEQGDQGDEPSGLYVLNADGTGRRLLVPDAGMPTWSPDGRFLIYIDRGSGALEVHRLDLETLQSTPVLSGGDHIHWYPAWSRDGKRVAFASSISTPSRCCSLHLMNPDGTDIRRIRFEGDDSIGANRPMWSPDGRRLVFEGFPRTGEEVVVVDTTGESLRRLTKGKFPSWCPVCEWIVFVVHERSGRGHLKLIRPDGTDERTLLTAGGSGGEQAPTLPSWSPDGEWIIFSRVSGGRNRLWLIRPDGTGLRMLGQ